MTCSPPQTTQHDATDMIYSTHVTSQQVVYWTPIIAPSPNQWRSAHVWGTHCICWKLRGGNVVQSPNGAPSTYSGGQEKGMSY